MLVSKVLRFPVLVPLGIDILGSCPTGTLLSPGSEWDFASLRRYERCRVIRECDVLQEKQTVLWLQNAQGRGQL